MVSINSDHEEIKNLHVRIQLLTTQHFLKSTAIKYAASNQ